MLFMLFRAVGRLVPFFQEDRIVVTANPRTGLFSREENFRTIGLALIPWRPCASFSCAAFLSWGVRCRRSAFRKRLKPVSALLGGDVSRLTSFLTTTGILFSASWPKPKSLVGARNTRGLILMGPSADRGVWRPPRGRGQTCCGSLRFIANGVARNGALVHPALCFPEAGQAGRPAAKPTGRLSLGSSSCSLALSLAR